MIDTIIIGGGSAGCVLAARLTEDPNTSVLLLEAGPRQSPPDMQVPAAFSRLFKTELDWNLETVPQAHVNQRQMYHPRGRVLGGSSAINAMIYIRGSHDIYDTWAAAVGGGWGWDAVLPYFKRAEDQARGADDYHGVGGPMRIEDPRDPRPLTLAFLQAAMQSGLICTNDFNTGTPDGAGLFQVTMRRGVRESAATAYLNPIVNRPNLRVQTGAQVQRILLEGGRAVGVEVRTGEVVQTIRARREVIVSAGAFHSPQLLMLSGIGPGEHLQAMGIPVRVDLPGVGQNLQDHPAAGIMQRCALPVSLANADRPGNVLKYLLARVGPLTSNVAEAGAYVRTRPDLPLPDIQFHFAPNYFIDHGLNVPAGHGFTLGGVMVTPKSRGTVRLASSLPGAAPCIDPAYFSDPDGADMASLVAALRLAREILAAPALAPFNAGEHTPGLDVQSDDALREYIRESSQTLYHPVGTCKMGGADDPLAVVDPRLRVRGVEGLRVVDASVMPLIPNGNTNAPTIMVAERAADLIRADKAPI